MAKVKGPLHSDEARGSVGGITYSMSVSGPVAKTKPVPNYDYKGYKPKVRSILGYLSRQWGELTNAQRESWNAWALDHPFIDAFGDEFSGSGFNCYISLNANAVRLGGAGAENALPPVDPPPTGVETLACSAGTNPGDLDLDWSELGTGLVTDHFEYQIAGPFQSEGRVAVESRFAYEGKVAGNVLTATVAGLDEGMWYWACDGRWRNSRHGSNLMSPHKTSKV